MAVLTAVLLAGGLLSTGIAHAAPAGPKVVRSVQQETAEGRELAVRVVGIARTAPVRVAWGDGTETVLRSACAPARAASRPQACAGSAAQVYATEGTYAVRVTSAGRVLLRESVVVGSVAPSAPATEAWQEEMLASVNAMRAAAGVPRLTLCAPVTKAAADYARVMAERSWFDHTGPDGSEPWDRMAAAGYAYRAAGENIAAGQEDVASVMQAWRDSPGHYANIVNKDFTHLGVGRAPSKDEYGIYWVQNFGRGGSC
jgi:uncharacterized protein YkwD